MVSAVSTTAQVGACVLNIEDNICWLMHIVNFFFVLLKCQAEALLLSVLSCASTPPCAKAAESFSAVCLQFPGSETVHLIFDINILKHVRSENFCSMLFQQGLLIF